MSRKTKAVFFTIAVCSMLAVCLLSDSTGNILTVAALPFVLVGNGLRALSLSGSVGNAVAIMIYGVICLSPLLPLVRRRDYAEDWLLVLTSAALFYVLYLMINPGRMLSSLGGDMGRVIYSGTVCSIVISWGCLKLLRAAGKQTLDVYKSLRVLLMCCAVLWIVAGFGAGFGECMATIASVREGNTMPGQNLLPTYLFAVLSFAVQAMEYSLDAVLLLWGVNLLQELEADAYSQQCCAVAERLGKRCKYYLTAIILSNLALNLGQICFASRLYNIDTTVRIPVFSMALLFGAMALSRLLSQGRELKEENDLYI